MGRENTPASDSQKKYKGKEKATSSTGISDNITLDDYDLDDSGDNFMEPIVPYVSSKSRPSFKQGTYSSKPSASSSEPSASAKPYISSSKQSGPYSKPSGSSVQPGSSEDLPFKKIMAVKTTVNNIWKHEYLNPLHELVDSLRSFLNKLFKRKEKAKSVREKMQAEGYSDKDIKEAIRKQVYVPCNDMKSVVSKKNMSAAGALDDESRAQLNTFFPCYPEDDVIVSPYLWSSKKLKQPFPKRN
ncbi:hypothetical protein HPULCUR_006001 [Helicostylum pulchrum]|uniref:Uncharacterized protein n=1 Tax=Helicostylum pulchrum TaxID=562976 RepID=A0ABP9Y0N6_9FUNG